MALRGQAKCVHNYNVIIIIQTKKMNNLRFTDMVTHVENRMDGGFLRIKGTHRTLGD